MKTKVPRTAILLVRSILTASYTTLLLLLNTQVVIAESKPIRLTRQCITSLTKELGKDLKKDAKFLASTCRLIIKNSNHKESFRALYKPEGLIDPSFEYSTQSLTGWRTDSPEQLQIISNEQAPDGKNFARLSTNSNKPIALSSNAININVDSPLSAITLNIKYSPRNTPKQNTSAIFMVTSISKVKKKARFNLLNMLIPDNSPNWQTINADIKRQSKTAIFILFLLGTNETVNIDNVKLISEDSSDDDLEERPNPSVSTTPDLSDDPPQDESASPSATQNLAVSPSPPTTPSSTASQMPSMSPSPSITKSPSSSASPTSSPSSSPSASASTSPSVSPSGLPPVDGCEGATGNIINLDAAWFADKAAPYYLDQPNTTYRLKQHVSTKGSAFALIANNITFDLCGNTVTYNNSPAINIPNWDFEIANESNPTKPDRWNVSNAPNAVLGNAENLSSQSNLAGQVLRINFPAPAQDIISEPFTLEANTTYSIAAVANRRSGSGDIYLALQDTPNRYKLKNKTNVVEYFKYTTGPAAETHRIGIQVRDGDSSTAFATIDKITVQKEANIGTIVGVASYNMPVFYNGYTRFGDASNARVKNGSIIQGTDNGTRSFPIFLKSDDSILSGLILRSRGIDTASIYSYYADFKMHSSTLYNDMELNTNRHTFRGYVIQGQPTVDFYNNSIIGGCQGGMVIGENSIIYNNTISLRSRFTNGFGVMSRGAKNSEIYNNNIDCSSEEDYSCRGIALHNDNAGTKVYNNNVSVRGLPNNDEYLGCQIGGMYAFQAEGETTGSPEVYANTFEAIGDACDGSAFRFNGSGRKGDYVHDNTFVAKKVSSKDVLVVSTNFGTVDDSETPSITFDNNTLITNMSWFKGLAVTNLKLTNNRLELIEDNFTTQYRLYNDAYNLDPLVHGVWGLTFIDSTFGSTRARNEFETQAIRRWWDRDRGWRVESWFQALYTTTIKVKNSSNTPMIGATVSVTDKDGNVVATGITDNNGEFKPEIRHFMTLTNSAQAIINTNYNLHSISASSGNLSGSISNININDQQTVEVTIM